MKSFMSSLPEAATYRTGRIGEHSGQEQAPGDRRSTQGARRGAGRTTQRGEERRPHHRALRGGFRARRCMYKSPARTVMMGASVAVLTPHFKLAEVKTSMDHLQTALESWKPALSEVGNADAVSSVVQVILCQHPKSRTNMVG
ncbi:uncharacterized protein PHA67_017315 isoform 1-T1 [Liasis olivaceus]